MEYICAALLLHKAGKEINEGNLTKVMKSVVEHPDEARIKTVVASLKGVNIDEALSSAAIPATTHSPHTKHEEKPEKEEEKPAEGAEGLAALFGWIDSKLHGELYGIDHTNIYNL